MHPKDLKLTRRDNARNSAQIKIATKSPLSLVGLDVSIQKKTIENGMLRRHVIFSCVGTILKHTMYMHP